MPYIGNQHNVGDHVNNFKVLDDISSHTATFDGSAASVVSAADDTIRIPEHRFIQGQRVTYTNGGGGNIGGLTTGTAYFVSFDSANTIKLATTLANANSNTVINLSSVGSGTSHTLNVAFDGINTKFKITHGSGKAARLNNATQLNVAINNVIQRPNINSVSFTEGFAIEDNHKIVFKTAPTVNDVFWGSIIANTIENFDLRDNEVDNFTGDGSTTEFTLSTIPANNESVVVSINGVVQHPSDKNTARSYTLIDSILEFTAAPALGDEIQVRHIGFAGASTNDVSGFYGRTGNVALISSDHITTGDITSRNINSSGIITATTFDGAFSSSVGGSNANFTGIVTAGVFKGGDIEGRNLKITGLSTFVGDASFTGNVSIGGTLTYEDVTNVDAVGIVTAREGVRVPNGSASANYISAGNSQDLKIYHDGSHSYIRDTGTGGLRITTDSFNVLKSNNGESMITGTEDGAVKLYYDHNLRLETQTSRTIFRGSGGIGVYGDAGSNQNGQISIHPTGSAVYSNLYFYNAAGNSYASIVGHAGGTLFFTGGTNGPLRHRVNGTGFHSFQEGNTQRVTITAGGTVNIGGDFTNTTGKLKVTGNSIFAGDIDVDGHTNLDNVSVAGISTFSGIVDAVNTPASIRVAQDIQHKGDANTKISFPANDEISLDTSGHDRIYIKSDGKIGMGTVTPAVNIHHFSDGLNGNGVRLENREGYVSFTNDANGLYIDAEYFNFRNRAGSTSYASINTSGNLSVFNDLDVDGHTNLDNVSIAGVSTFTGQARFGGEIVAETLISVQSGGSINIPDKLIHSGDADTAIRFPAVDTISFETAGSEALRITHQGRIGLNGVVPTSSHANVTSSIHLADSNTILSRTGNQYFALYQNLKQTSADVTRYLVNGYASAYAQNAGTHRFYTVGNGTGNTNATVTERLRITNTGTVNIGGDYTNTTGALKVTGNTNIDGTLTAGVGFVCAGGYSIFSGNVTQQGYTFHDADSDTYFGFPSNDQFAIFTAGTQRLKIYSNGNSDFDVAGGTLKVTGTGAYGLSIHNTNSPSMGHLFIYGDNGLIRFRNSSNTYTAQIGYSESTNSLFLYNQEGGTTLDVIDDGVKIGDNKKFLCGNDQDLEIYHNNSNGFIKNGTGQLLFRSGQHVFENAAGSVENLRIKSDGRVSINDGSPSSGETLTIRPLGNAACDVSLKMNHSTDSRIKFYDDGGVWRGAFGFTNYANNTTYPNFHDSFYMMTDPGSNGSLETVMRINREGAFMYPKQPCFSVVMSNDYSSSTNHVANFDTERFDQGNNFNTGSNGIFTAPVSGKYYMHATIQTQAGGTASQVHIMGVSFLVNGSVNASKGSGDQYWGRNAAYYLSVHCIRILDLAQGDTVQVYIQLHGTVAIEGSGGTDRCNWQGYLMA